ncbi:MarR family winged helix-turn-helix transcriptional regulator [Mesorhizobium japonicum]|uniref:MarR family winged helix-turn-helix transcriptional regulator n=1 Tax=Mesorhizobium japonicum TaxID=2066070 RepID=UPI003B5AF414
MDDDATPGPARPEPGELSSRVRVTVGRLYRRFRSERQDGALGETALEVLSYLEKNGSHTLTELSEIGHVAPASMSQSVNRLAAAGYVVRIPDAGDRRKVLLRATDEGAEFAAAARAQRNAWLEGQLQKLGVDDQVVLLRACELLGAIADS